MVLKGPVYTAHSGISATATSNEFDMCGMNAVLVSVLITGTGTWNIKVQGRFDTSGTTMDLYDNNDNILGTGDITVSRMKLIVAVPDLIKIVATEVVDGATCTVRIQPIII